MNLNVRSGILDVVFKEKLSIGCERIEKIASFRGVSINSVSSLEVGQIAQLSECILLDVESFKGTDLDWRLIKNELIAKKKSILIHFSSNDESTLKVIHDLVSNDIECVVTRAASIEANYSMSSLTGTLFGQVFRDVINRERITYKYPNDSEYNLILGSNLGDIFSRFRVGKSNVFLWSEPFAGDLDEMVDDDGYKRSALTVTPVLIFLNDCLSEYCWSSPYKYAAVTIDDPLLKSKYGYINFPEFLKSAKDHDYRITLDFIPWNYKRTSRRIANNFAKNNNFDICVHGCDHTNNEFGSLDFKLFSSKSQKAMDRLQDMEKRTGMAFEPFMIFPQGRFSTKAITALRTNGCYLGAINSTVIPVESRPEGCKLRDQMAPVATNFHGFSVLSRRDPSDRRGFALDAFYGKHVIMKEHHQFFKEGTSGVEKFALYASRIITQPEWNSVGEILRRTHSCRRTSEEVLEVKFYSTKFTYEKRDRKSELVNFHFRIGEGDEVAEVLVDSKKVEYNLNNSVLKFHCFVESDSRADVLIEMANRKNVFNIQPDLKYELKVFTRRAMSEFRDNFLCKSVLANRLAQFVVDLLGMSSSSLGRKVKS